MSVVRRYVLFFVALSCIYHSNLRPIASGDSLPGSLIPFSLLLDGSLTLNRFGPWLEANVPYARDVVLHSGGDWYSRYPIAGPVFATPLYVPLALLPPVRKATPGTLVSIARIAEKFAAVTITALSAVWMLALLRRLAPDRWAWPLAWLYAAGTAAWSTSSQALWQHTFGLAAIAACFYFLDRCSFLWCGIAMAIAVMVRPTNLVLLPAVAAAVWSVRPWLRLFAPATIGLTLIAAYNWHVFGAYSGGYPARLDYPLLGGLAGILFSPGRGLLIYTPVVAFAFAAFLPRASRDHATLRTAAALFSVLHIAVIAKWPMWWGGYCWGPRLLSEAIPGAIVLIALAAPALDDLRPARYALTAAALYGIAIQAIGVYFYPKGHWDHLPVSVSASPSRLWDWRDSPISRTLAAGPAREPFLLLTTALKDGVPAAGEKLRELGINPW